MLCIRIIVGLHISVSIIIIQQSPVQIIFNKDIDILHNTFIFLVCYITTSRGEKIVSHQVHDGLTCIDF